MTLKSLRLSGALLAVAAVVITPPVAFGYQALKAETKSTIYSAPAKKVVVARCTKANRTVTVPVSEQRRVVQGTFGFEGVVKVALCTDRNGTTVYGQTTKARAIENDKADVSLAIGKPRTSKHKGTTTIVRPAKATITTKWKNKYSVTSNIIIKVTRAGNVSVLVGTPFLGR